MAIAKQLNFLENINKNKGIDITLTQKLKSEGIKEGMLIAAENMIKNGDTLIVTEISRLGRSTSEVIHLINTMLEKNIRIISIKQNIDINKHDISSKIIVAIFSLLAELERDLVSLRTKEALSAKKAKGIKLGKPLGTIQKSKFDKDIERIKELLSLGVSIRKSSKILGYSNYIGLHNYIKT